MPAVAPRTARRLGGVALLSALLLATAPGCSSEDSDAGPADGGSSSPAGAGEPSASSPAQRAAAYCEGLLSTSDASALAGTGLDAPEVQSISGIPGCRWQAADGADTSVQLVNASSSTWAAELPEITQALTASGVKLGATLRGQVADAQRAIAGGAEVDADVACEIFIEISRVTGYGRDVDSTVQVSPSAAAPETIIAQGCASDEYSFLQLTSPDLGDDVDRHVDEVQDVLQQVHGAPFGQGVH